jgi:hypothetical protein
MKDNWFGGLLALARAGWQEHWFWWLVTMACLLWYSVITVYVGVKGVLDIKHMLNRLAVNQAKDKPPDQS